MLPFNFSNGRSTAGNPVAAFILPRPTALRKITFVVARRDPVAFVPLGHAVFLFGPLLRKGRIMIAIVKKPRRRLRRRSILKELNRSKGLKVPFNWDYSLLQRFGDLNRGDDTLYPVCEVYAADKKSLIGSGRGGNSLASRKLPLESYTAEAHRHGIRFDYLLNAPSCGGEEYSADMKARLLDETQKLMHANVDSLTVANPMIATLIRSHFPDIHLSTSVNNHLDSVERVIQLFEHIPFDTIMLDHRCSREIGLVRQLRCRFPDNDIVVLVNESCLPDCPLQPSHQEFLACSSRIGATNGDTIDLCHLYCARYKLNHPSYVLKAPWVRPEDIHYVYEAGATMIKLAGRTKPSEWILELATAYGTSHYDGDVWRLIEKSGLTSPDWDKALGRSLEPCRYVVHNGALDGFIRPFVEGRVPCVQGPGGCGSCRYCDSWMSKAVENPPNRNERLDDLTDLLEIVNQPRVHNRCGAVA